MGSNIPAVTMTDGSALSSAKSIFKQLTVYKHGLISLDLCPEGSETPIFHVAVSASWNPNTPNFKIHAGPDSKGPVKGVAHIRDATGHHMVGLGDPDAGTGHKAVQWENLDRIQTINPRHRFCCEVGGERRWFLWRKPGKWYERVGDMELVEDSEAGINIEGDGPDEREILVKYSKPTTAFKKKRGTFEIKEGMGEDWEMMVLLTGMIMVLIHRKNNGK